MQDTKNATTARINTGLLHAAQTTPAHEKRELDFDPSGKANMIAKEYYWGRRYRKPIDYKFKNGTMPKTSEREVAH